MLRWFEHSRIYFPDRVLTATGQDLGRPFEEADFTARDDVRLHGWFFPADQKSLRGNRVILFCHGNAGNIGDRLDMAEVLLECGVAVFLLDYRGYGRSEGRPGEEGTYSDAQAAHRWLRERGFVAQNIIVYGESLGGGIASELAIRETVAGLILENTFTSIPEIGAELYPWLPVRWISTIKYDTFSRLPRLRVPVMVMHSREDELIRFHHGEKNFANAREPKIFWELKGSHNAPISDRANFLKGIQKFFELIDFSRKDTVEAK